MANEADDAIRIIGGECLTDGHYFFTNIGLTDVTVEVKVVPRDYDLYSFTFRDENGQELYSVREYCKKDGTYSIGLTRFLGYKTADGRTEISLINACQFDIGLVKCDDKEPEEEKHAAGIPSLEDASAGSLKMTSGEENHAEEASVAADLTEETSSADTETGEVPAEEESVEAEAFSESV